MMYKILQDGGRPCVGGGQWYLPQGKLPGKWMPKIETLRMCESGYHVLDAACIIDFLDYGYHIFEVEVRGESFTRDYKACHQQARLLRELQWGEREARLFACDCAERALDLWVKSGTVDPRSRAAVDVARRFANGEATVDERDTAKAAAIAAVRAAAWNTARAEAWDAARTSARTTAEAAAWNAAWDAARTSAEAAAWNAAWNAERQWQIGRLLDYLYGRI